MLVSPKVLVIEAERLENTFGRITEHGLVYFVLYCCHHHHIVIIHSPIIFILY